MAGIGERALLDSRARSNRMSDMSTTTAPTYTVTAANNRGDTIELGGMTEPEMRRRVEQLRTIGMEPFVVVVL